MQSVQWVRLIFTVLGDHGLMDRQKTKQKKNNYKNDPRKTASIFFLLKNYIFLEKIQGE